MSKHIISEACSLCNYNEIPRTADITLADFWGVPKEYDDNKGVSLILANNKTGIETINILQSKSKIFMFESTLEYAQQGTWRINSNKLDLPFNRKEFFVDSEKMTMKELHKKYIKTNLYHRIKNRILKLIH